MKISETLTLYLVILLAGGTVVYLPAQAALTAFRHIAETLAALP